MAIILKRFGISGYCSFGKDLQFFDNLGHINLFIGRNNAGKSNVLRLISDVIGGNGLANPSELDTHLPDKPPFLLALDQPYEKNSNEEIVAPKSHRLIKDLRNRSREEDFRKTIGKAIEERVNSEHTKHPWSYLSRPDLIDRTGNWEKALKKNTPEVIGNIYTALKNSAPSSHEQALHTVARYLHAAPPNPDVVMLSATRRIGSKDSGSETFDGDGIIERLSKLQNPNALEQHKKSQFQRIVTFVQNVFEDASVNVEIPYERDTILIHIQEKTLPIESLGSGMHEVIILAAAATVLENHIICIEEPELHLNPTLQRKFMAFLAQEASNQYFIATHSSSVLDCARAEIYHLKLEDNETIVSKVTTDPQRTRICRDLGYHPSDLLQANCIIWVEGPSDRIYLAWWLNSTDSELIEGVHYAIMFYGGRLLSHLSYATENVDNFIKLRKLNQHGVILIDSDRTNKSKDINSTKQRLVTEFSDEGYSWVTQGREVENYVSRDILVTAIRSVHPSCTLPPKMGTFDNCLLIKNQKGEKQQANKVSIAHRVVESGPPEFSLLDLQSRLNELARFIRACNP